MADANNSSPEPAEVQQPTVEQSPRQRAELLMTTLNNDKSITELFGDSFQRQYQIFGKSPAQWRDHFRINVPKDSNPAQLNAILAELATLYQEASSYYAVSEAMVDALDAGSEREFTNAFNKRIAEYKAKGISLPAQKTLETIAKHEMLDVAGAATNAKIIKNFWRRMLEGLTEVRKTLETATWNNHILANQERFSGGNIPTTPARERFGKSAHEQHSSVACEVVLTGRKDTL